MLAHDAAIVEAAALLRPLSHSTSALLELSNSDSVDMTAVSNVVTNDQVLAAAVLREANSASSAARGQIGTVHAALIRMGLGRVVTLAVRTSVSDQLGGALPEYGLAAGELALNSVVGSIAAELVREHSATSLPQEITTAALLRDIGMLVLATFLDPAHRTLLDVTHDAGVPLSAGERMVLDASHGEVGAVLCQAWNLSDGVRLGVQYHHGPEACDEPIAHGVFVADAVANGVALRFGATWSHATPDLEALIASMEALGLDIDSLETLVDSTIDRFEHRDTGLSLGASPIS